MMTHFYCADVSALCDLARVVGPHFTAEPDATGAVVGAVDCRDASSVAFVRGLTGVQVLPLPSKHANPLAAAEIGLLANYGVVAGDTMTDALAKIYARHPVPWFDSRNF